MCYGFVIIKYCLFPSNLITDLTFVITSFQSDLILENASQYTAHGLYGRFLNGQQQLDKSSCVFLMKQKRY